MVANFNIPHFPKLLRQNFSRDKMSANCYFISISAIITAISRSISTPATSPLITVH